MKKLLAIVVFISTPILASQDMSDLPERVQIKAEFNWAIQQSPKSLLARSSPSKSRSSSSHQIPPLSLPPSAVDEQAALLALQGLEEFGLYEEEDECYIKGAQRSIKARIKQKLSHESSIHNRK